MPWKHTERKLQKNNTAYPNTASFQVTPKKWSAFLFRSLLHADPYGIWRLSLIHENKNLYSYRRDQQQGQFWTQGILHFKVFSGSEFKCVPSEHMHEAKTWLPLKLKIIYKPQLKTHKTSFEKKVINNIS